MAAMVTFIKSLTMDCRDALAGARFWAAVLGSDVDVDEDVRTDPDLVVMQDPEGNEFCVE
jgi:hypothetical protein